MQWIIRELLELIMLSVSSCIRILYLIGTYQEFNEDIKIQDGYIRLERYQRTS
jgi:hypothetical protein